MLFRYTAQNMRREIQYILGGGFDPTRPLNVWWKRLVSGLWSNRYRELSGHGQ